MKNSPLISIIIPNFNTEKYLVEAIESVLTQNYKNWELIIVDDHSTDKSVEIIKQYSNKYENIHFYQTPKNSGGPATPRNVGIDKSNGIYIAFLDSDDTWFPNRLEFHVDFMLRENALFTSTLRHEFHDPGQMRNIIKDTMQLKVYSFKRLLKKNLIDTSAVIIHKDLIGNIRFNPAKELIAIEDFDFWIQILTKYPDERIIVPQVETINYRLTGENISGAKFKMAKKFICILKKHNIPLTWRLYYFFNYSVQSLIYYFGLRTR
jgi:teichuronic acid biosynthesis glycosyltransferase TuaG